MFAAPTDEEIASSVVSDLYKDVYGFRPRHKSFWDNWNAASDSGKEEIMDELAKELERNQAEEQRYTDSLIEQFESRIKAIIDIGAGDRETAIRWMTSEDEASQSHFDAEHFVYECGLLFTDYGKNLVAEIIKARGLEE